MMGGRGRSNKTMQGAHSSLADRMKEKEYLAAQAQQQQQQQLNQPSHLAQHMNARQQPQSQSSQQQQYGAYNQQ